ncbi:hypothetical protein CISIN_1g0473361mg, partial [Citrus sinensis]
WLSRRNLSFSRSWIQKENIAALWKISISFQPCILAAVLKIYWADYLIFEISEYGEI